MKVGKYQIDYTKTNDRYEEHLVCDCGSFSATRGDYWMRDSSANMQCDDCGADMWLERRGHIVGKTPDGLSFGGFVWVDVAYPVTPAQLQDLDGSRLVALSQPD